jgi:putative transposase
VVRAVRGGKSQREVAREFDTPISTVQHWLARAASNRLDRVDWETRPPKAHRTTRTSRGMEDTVLAVRKELREFSVLGEYSARAIHDELLHRGYCSVPSTRTIGRILARRGALDKPRRVRRPPPPPGWYLPAVARRQAELDSFDVVKGLVIEGGIDVQVLNGISLHGRLAASWQDSVVTAKMTVEKLTVHWQEFGLPGYVQFDNDTRFQGAHHYQDSFGRVIRLCLSLGVIPVFAPIYELGFQAAVESFNWLWQTKVWSRFHHQDIPQLRGRSQLYVNAHRAKTAGIRELAPARQAFPEAWTLNLQAPLRGRVIFLRRTDGAGKVGLLGRRFSVSGVWPYRLVRCEVNLDENMILFFTLRRSKPNDHNLVKTIAYTPPARSFIE